MSKLLSPNEILSAYQAVYVLASIAADNYLMVDAEEAKILITESVKKINETIKSIIPNATLSADRLGNGFGFTVKIEACGRFLDCFYIVKCEDGCHMEAVNASFRKAEANLIKSYLELLNEAEENSEQL